MEPKIFQTRDFDFALPPELIAQRPAEIRSQARLLDGRSRPPVDRVFEQLPRLLEPSDLIVFNDSRVVKARLIGFKPTGGLVELLVERVLDDRRFVAHVYASRKPKPGTSIKLQGDYIAKLLGHWPDDTSELFVLEITEDPFLFMQEHGHVPLPPYIRRAADEQDIVRYQSILAQVPGSAAAPTASLHFDQELLDRLDARGIARATVTLHVGAGTFSPVHGENLAEHVMHWESYDVPQQTQEAIAQCKARKGRVVAVGTTALRSLESWAKSGIAQDETDLFITPGFAFACVDTLITNFHLPRSTLMMLVSAFAGHARIMELYQHAIEERYRFFSYGDAMILDRCDRSDRID